MFHNNLHQSIMQIRILFEFLKLTLYLTIHYLKRMKWEFSELHQKLNFPKIIFPIKFSQKSIQTVHTFSAKSATRKCLYNQVDLWLFRSMRGQSSSGLDDYSQEEQEDPASSSSFHALMFMRKLISESEILMFPLKK